MFNAFLTPTPPTDATPIAASGSWPKAEHHWSLHELRALAAAGFSGRPLLVKGEPGVGKSQLARAAAALLRWRFEYEVITPRLEPQDLMWRFDAVRRLADAGVKRADADGTQRSGLLDNDKAYFAPGVLWRALDPQSAASLQPSKAGQPVLDERPCVLLLDEIDKADSDLPNSLLEVLGNRSFTTPWGEQIPSLKTAAERGLLIVITSNDERELPLAFLRRCVVLDLEVPDEKTNPEGFVEWLVERGAPQFPQLTEALLREAAVMVRADRKDSPRGQGARPGLAEYLDLLRALKEISATSAPGATEKATRGDGAAIAAIAELQTQWLAELRPYVLRKQGRQQAVRPAQEAKAD